MKYRLNWNTIKLYLITIAFIALGVYVFNTVKELKSSGIAETDVETDLLLNGNGEYSNGYDHGTIYSIDGKAISADIQINIDGVNHTRHSGIPEFSSVLGMEGFVGTGLINQLDVTLHSSARKANTENRTGNNIQTTFSASGQKVASALLEQYFPLSGCENGASLTIVLKDGSILVAAGSNGYDVSLFDLNNTDSYPQDICNDKTITNYAAGSVAKTITAATLLMNDQYLDAEYSLYNDHFSDLSYFSHGGYTISNHDRYNVNAYESAVTANSNQLIRHISLAEALVLSSNTYFWRHALHYGLDRTFNSMNEIFSITQPLQTEVSNIPPVEVDRDRLDYFYWGQDFFVSPVFLCSMYNYALSGEKYSPFYITSVSTPDNVEVYRANPEVIEMLQSSEEMQNFLKDGLSQCFMSYCKNIDSNIYQQYSQLIEEGRILAKSGTADVLVNQITNHTRVLTLLDENHDVIATACIAVNRAVNSECKVNDNILFTILLKTLEAAGIL